MRNNNRILKGFICVDLCYLRIIGLILAASNRFVHNSAFPDLLLWKALP